MAFLGRDERTLNRWEKDFRVCRFTVGRALKGGYTPSPMNSSAWLAALQGVPVLPVEFRIAQPASLLLGFPGMTVSARAADRCRPEVLAKFR